MSTKALEQELQTLVAKGSQLGAEVSQTNGGVFTAEQQAEVKAITDRATEIKNQLLAIKAGDDQLAQLNAIGLEVGTIAKTASAPAAKGRLMTPGQKFTESDSWQNYMKQIAPNGEVSKGARVHSDAIAFRGAKDILSGSDSTDGPGLLVNQQELGLIDTGRLGRELKFRDLVASGTTTSDTIHYVTELAQTNNAAPVAEAAGVEPYAVGAGQVQGVKPQSSFTLGEASTTVKTIAHWIPVTKRALADAAQIRTLIDNFLRYGLEEELEDQIVNGSGSGENFTGILNTSGTQTQAWDTDLLITTRKAKTKVRTVGKAVANAFVFNPEDNERIDLLQGTNGYGDPSGYIFGNPAGLQVQTLWGLPRIESEAVPAGTGLVADFKRAILWDREQAGIYVSTEHADFFIRNLVAILAELRAAFTVIRPNAFVEIDLTA